MYKYSLYDTIVCSYSRVDEFRRVVNERPVDERCKVVANQAMPHDYIFYVDADGLAYKYQIEENERGG